MKQLSPNESKMISVGIQFVASVFVFWYLGKLLDEYFQTRFIQLAGLMFGIIGSITKLILVVKQLDEKPTRNKNK